MNTNVKHTLIFVAGAAVGSVATWQFVKTKYEKLVQEEIASIKAALSGPKMTITPSEPKPEKSPDEIIQKTDLMSYASELQKNGYTNYSNPGSEEKEEEAPAERPYIISPEDFGEYADYEKISLTHYADGVLADEDNEIVDNVDDIVGSDYACHFGEYEDDSVHVRNDAKKCDYEILRDLRKYLDVTGSHPHWME